MLKLTREMIPEYLKARMPGMDFSHPLDIHMVGEGTIEEDGDGFLNYIYKVSDGKTKLILKQGGEHGRVGMTKDFDLPVNRTKLEYDTMKIRSAIVPEYVPKLYFYDSENFIMGVEDVSHLKIMRFQLNKNVTFPGFAKKIAEFMAKTHFYTSEYYLSTKMFRDLTVRFMNHQMRNVMDDILFISTEDEHQDFGIVMEKEYAPFIRKLILDPLVVEARYELKRKYITNGECFVHADLHTSNIMLDEREMKVIDMEYTFCGPFASDIGYLESNFLSQYVCAAYRPFESEEKRGEFRKWCLDTMREILEEYLRIFFACWDKDVKKQYRNVPGLKESIGKQLLSDAIGFTATASFNRTVGFSTLPEYKELGDGRERREAICATMIFDRTSLLRRDTYRSPKEWTDELASVTDLFMTFQAVKG